ncbi:hypothetical protein KKF61_02055 [Patescibacteria group bacterium]|nr:hypothetical protein [Patescibacteria group bacterium]MBU0963695.1 hypothetical protein [Patescibacteria group bacterium]
MIDVRRANCDDGQIISELLKSKYSFSTREEAAAVFKDECQNQHYRIAEINGRVVGLISWRLQGTPKHGVAELTRFIVQQNIPNYQSVKESLYDVMMAEADYYYKQHGSRLHKVFSMIHADDKQIKEFYIDKGMRQEAVLKDHFHIGKDELVFSLFLPSV